MFASISLIAGDATWLGGMTSSDGDSTVPESVTLQEVRKDEDGA
jgi:hypothetical protein